MFLPPRPSKVAAEWRKALSHGNGCTRLHESPRKHCTNNIFKVTRLQRHVQRAGPRKDGQGSQEPARSGDGAGEGGKRREEGTTEGGKARTKAGREPEEADERRPGQEGR